MHEAMSPHRQEAENRLSPVGKKFFNLIEFDDQEELVLEIRKHSFGAVLIVLVGLFIILFFFAIAILLSISFRNGLVGSTGSYSGALIGGAVILSGFAVFGILLSVIVFINDVIFVTNEKIAQVLYKNIISRKVSQLNIGDVQDVTVNQNNIFARIFNYGTLVIETAGEQNNYIFSYVPRPASASNLIIEAHESYVAKYGN